MDTKNWGQWALPRNHPILVMLLEEIQALRDKTQELELSRAMYFREIEQLQKVIGPEHAQFIHEHVWGK